MKSVNNGNIRDDVLEMMLRGYARIVVDESGHERVALTEKGWAYAQAQVPPEQRKPWPGYFPSESGDGLTLREIEKHEG